MAVGSDPAEEDLPAVYAENKAVFEAFVPEARELAVKALGIYRHGDTLMQAKTRLEEMLGKEEMGQDTKAAQTVASIHLMVCAALRREESRGTHMRLDFPESRKEFEREFSI